MARKTTITGAGIRDDSVTGDDIDESTLILDTLRDADGDTKVQVEESADGDKIRFDTAGAERMIITDAGAVGIGTSTPDNTLHVKSPGTTHIKIESESGYESALKLKSGTESSAYVWQPGNTSDLRFYVNGADRMHIDNNGKIGIGTTDPGDLLTINAAADGDECFIKFEEGGADRAKVGINSSNNLLIHNQYTNKHIVMKVNDAGVTREGFRLNGSVPEVVVNESSESLVDFRVESDSNTHMLYVDGGNNKIGINDSTPTSTLTVQGSIAMSVLSINAANDPGTTYTIADSDCVILVNTRPSAQGGIDSAITLTLPSASSNPGMILTIKDAGGYSNINNITISRAGSDTIEGVATTISLNVVAAFTTLISNGSSDWSEIGKG